MTDDQELENEVEVIEDLIDQRVRMAMANREVAAMVVDPYEAMRRQRVRDQQLAKELQMDYAPYGGIYKVGAQWYDANGNAVQANEAQEMLAGRTLSFDENGDIHAAADFIGDKPLTARRGRKKA